MSKDTFRYTEGTLPDKWGMLPNGMRVPSQRAQEEFLQMFSDKLPGVGPKTTPYEGILASQSYTDRMFWLTHYATAGKDSQDRYVFAPADSLHIFHDNGQIRTATVEHVVRAGYERDSQVQVESYTLSHMGDTHEYRHGGRFLKTRIIRDGDSLELEYQFVKEPGSKYLDRSVLSGVQFQAQEANEPYISSRDNLEPLIAGMNVTIPTPTVNYLFALEGENVMLTLLDGSRPYGTIAFPLSQSVDEIVCDSGIPEIVQDKDMNNIKPGDYNSWRTIQIPSLLNIDWDIRRRRKSA